MFFASDNAGPAHPAILSALGAANTGFASGYGADPLTIAVTQQLREIFEAPEASVHLVATGTAANALALATLANPWDTIFCTPDAHIQQDECNAPEFFAGGAKLTLVGTGDKLTPDTLRTAVAAEQSRGVHGPQRGPVAITQATERGRIYSVAEITELTAVAREFGIPAHLDGARFANALVALNCTPADMTWRAGVDAVSFGGTKNGCLGVEAVIFFDPARAWEFELRRKRGAHLFSKHRFLAAQMQAYLTDGLWLDLARRANASMARLADGLRGIEGVRFTAEPQANMLFPEIPRHMHDRLQAAGAVYYLWDGAETGAPEDRLTLRLVTDWSLPEAEIDRFLSLARG
ncbi:threonine aldolase family protein [Pseudooceanicola aestuarii]|uniref:threonine aldolase family protein n=1 Tax=Pseudooceanicola aestuarii TaxID=2697319 RepID=UPI0013D84254|nr:beta-eliminating lyase-related protein [Pseudooceanicola aestuarii]